jgi:hypothetical protein
MNVPVLVMFSPMSVLLWEKQGELLFGEELFLIVHRKK